MQLSNLAGGPRPAFCRPPVSGPKVAKLHEAKKKLIATAPDSKLRLTYWKQMDCSIFNRDKNGPTAVCSSHSALVSSQCFYD
jgi:hypothetical protein